MTFFKRIVGWFRKWFRKKGRNRGTEQPEKLVVPNDLFFSWVLSHLEMEPAIPVKGFSMLPFIRGGKDLVVLEQVKDDWRVDDIVLFHIGPQEGGRYIMHRILRIDGDRVEIMGDGVLKNREHVTRDCLLARAQCILRGGARKVDTFNYRTLPAGVKAVDPYSPAELRKVHLWQRIRPARRYILFVYRHLPWNRSWLKENL